MACGLWRGGTTGDDAGSCHTTAESAPGRPDRTNARQPWRRSDRDGEAFRQPCDALRTWRQRRGAAWPRRENRGRHVCANRVGQTQADRRPDGQCADHECDRYPLALRSHRQQSTFQTGWGRDHRARKHEETAVRDPRSSGYAFYAFARRRLTDSDFWGGS